MIKINEIHIYETVREADALLDNGYIVSMDYLNAENEFTEMYNNPEKYDTCDIYKYDRR